MLNNVEFSLFFSLDSNDSTEFVSDMKPTTSLHVMISSLYFMALSNNTAANSDCPDDGGMTDDVTGCPTGDVKAALLLFPPYMTLENDATAGGYILRWADTRRYFLQYY